MRNQWFVWWKVYDNGYRAPQLWQFDKELLTIAPLARKPFGGHVQCTTCGKWINGYFLSINRHARKHKALGEDMNWVHFFEESAFSDN